MDLTRWLPILRKERVRRVQRYSRRTSDYIRGRSGDESTRPTKSSEKDLRRDEWEVSFSFSFRCRRGFSLKFSVGGTSSVCLHYVSMCFFLRRQSSRLLFVSISCLHTSYGDHSVTTPVKERQIPWIDTSRPIPVYLQLGTIYKVYEISFMFSDLRFHRSILEWREVPRLNDPSVYGRW